MHLLHSFTLRVLTLCFAGFALPACDEAPSNDALPEKLDRGSPGKADGLPSGWDCSATYYDAGDGCDCGCGAPDPDCAVGNVCDYEWCFPAPAHGGVFSQCTDTDTGGGGGGGGGSTAPSSWTCGESYYGTADGCDCGCGTSDPDCSGVNACDYEWCYSPLGGVFTQCTDDGGGYDGGGYDDGGYDDGGTERTWYECFWDCIEYNCETSPSDNDCGSHNARWSSVQATSSSDAHARVQNRNASCYVSNCRQCGERGCNTSTDPNAPPT